MATTITVEQVLALRPCSGAQGVLAFAAGATEATLREAIDLLSCRARQGWLLAEIRPDLGASLVARLGHAPASDLPTIVAQLQWIAPRVAAEEYDALMAAVLDEGGE